MDYFFIGDPELATAFRFVGIRGTGAGNAEEAVAAFRRITEGWDETAKAVLPEIEGCRILIITEEVADWLGDTLIQWQLSDNYPLIVEIPGIMGRLPGRMTLVDSIREAIGIHV
ncbi:MAG: ATPase V [Spirochaetaceae bacterium]|nr:ATPase V [Spirochaetaceae bacterium]